MGVIGLVHMMDERSAATHTFSHDNLHSQSGQQANGRFVDLGRDHRLGAPVEQRHPALAHTFGGKHLRHVDRGWRTKVGRRQIEHRPHPAPEQSPEGACQQRAGQHRAEPQRMWD